MIIHEGSEEGAIRLKKPHSAVVTSGTFDGVHIGHQKILARLEELARQTGGETVVVTYWPHPRFVLHPEDETMKLLSTFEEKATLLESLGVDHLVKIPFTKAFSQLSSDAFIRKILVEKINTRYLIIGYDHRFGKNREGSFEYLKEHAGAYGFAVEEIPRQDVDHIGVSSTKIRNALAAGDVHTANEYLGRPYQFRGLVTDGKKLGRSIGFPTANLQMTEPYKLIPADGVYAVRVKMQDQAYEGMMNIGFRPTVDGSARKVEVHLFDFNQSVYGEIMDVSVIANIRKEIKFENIEALKTQLARDKQTALRILDRDNHTNTDG